MAYWKSRIVSHMTTLLGWWHGILQSEENRWRTDAGLPPLVDPKSDEVTPTACANPDEPVSLSLLIAQRQAETAAREDVTRN